MDNWQAQLELFNGRLAKVRNNNMALEKTKETLIKAVEDERAKHRLFSEKHALHEKALAVLNKLSEDAIGGSLQFIESNLNDVLARIFVDSPRKIKLKEDIERGKIPVLHIELTAANGIKRSLKADSGHGLRQLVSLLCILCIITITGQRKFLVLDEVMTGMSREMRKAVDEILWCFTEIGFQFVIAEHGFRSKGSKVYQFKLTNDTSEVINEYIEPNGYYLGDITLEPLANPVP